MKFRRTSNGLSNQHLFFKVDSIVFVEGGQGFSKDEIVKGNFDTNSMDIIFWRGIFAIFHKNEKVQFRAIGSKPILKNIAEDIEAGKIKNAYVAMDRDFDFLKKTNIKYKGVIYTYGYSWENDVWQIEVVEDVINSICSADCKIANIKDEILQIYNAFIDQIGVGVCADALLSIKDNSFFNRKKHLSYLKFGKKNKPTVNLERIKLEFQECKLTEIEAKNFGVENDIQVKWDCLGHLISDFCYQIVVYLINKIGKPPSIAKYYFNCIGIDKFIRKLSNRCFTDIYLHYDKKFSLLI